MTTDKRLVPHDILAEEAVIGSLLIDGDALGQIRQLQTSDFYHEPLGAIFGVCKELERRRESIDRITVTHELERVGKLEVCGGVAYILQLISQVSSPLDIEDYAKIVSRLSVCRQMIVLSEMVANIGYHPDPKLSDSMDKLNTIVSKFKKQNTQMVNLVKPRDAAEVMLDMARSYKEPRQSLSYGFRELDEITTGIYQGEMVVVGARPSVGKTQLMLDIKEHLLFLGKTVLFVSAEMPIRQILERQIARELHIGVRRLRQGNLSETNENQIFDLAGRVSESNVYYLPRGTSSQDVYAEAERLQEDVGLDCVFVDYLQILSDCYTEKDNQNVRVSRACKNLKSLATDLNLPVIVASQLNRGLEYRAEGSKKPTLADLRDSGSIEQDADVVLLLHRDEEDESKLEIKMAKNRQMGQAKAINLQWDGKRHRYANYGEVNTRQEALIGDD
jgi:replicative DNA helicase